MKYAVIDLGTNTFKMLIAEVDSNGIVLPVYKKELPVKLGEGGINQKIITPKAHHRGLEALGRLVQTAREKETQKIIAVATSGLRSAGNGKLFIDEVYSKFKIEIRTVTGNEEAELIYRGARQVFDFPEKPLLILDIGGGSNEFIYADKKRVYWKKSYDLGIARLIEQFSLSDPVKQEEVNMVNGFLDEKMSDLLEYFRDGNPDTIIGCAGTFETYRSILEHQENSDFHYHSNDRPVLVIDRPTFDKLFNLLVFSNYKERTQIPGLALFRVDMIVLATIFVNFIVEKFNITNIIQSDYALREGVLDEVSNP